MHFNTVLVAVVQLLMTMISTNTAQLTIIATRDVMDNNIIRLTCSFSHLGTADNVPAAFYRRVPQDGRQILINSNVVNVEFVITIYEEGTYFCTKCWIQSNFLEVNGNNFIINFNIIILLLFYVIQHSRLQVIYLI